MVKAYVVNIFNCLVSFFSLSYLKLYGRKFSKEDHLYFVHIFFELTTSLNLDPQYVIAFGHVVIQLLK